MNLAIYRIHYGIDFLKASIDSIIDSVDLVYVFYSLDPWAKKDTVFYLGEEIPMPKLNEDVEGFLNTHYGDNPKVKYLRAETTTPHGQYSSYLSVVSKKIKEKIDTVLFMEPDFVFFKPDLKYLYEELEEHEELPCLGTKQIELWKTHKWRIPKRDRIGPMLWNIDRADRYDPSYIVTHLGTYNIAKPFVTDSVDNYNFGFCLNPTTMLYKHLTAINFSRVIRDSIPSQEWYRDKWLNWTPETTDLEISEKYKSNIAKAEIYSMDKRMIKQMGFI
jgi:hypothetical protein